MKCGTGAIVISNVNVDMRNTTEHIHLHVLFVSTCVKLVTLSTIVNATHM